MSPRSLAIRGGLTLGTRQHFDFYWVKSALAIDVGIHDAHGWRLNPALSLPNEFGRVIKQTVNNWIRTRSNNRALRTNTPYRVITQPIVLSRNE